jgi:hypothetical protein
MQLYQEMLPRCSTLPQAQKQMEPTDHDLNLLKHWIQVNLSSLEVGFATAMES